MNRSSTTEYDKRMTTYNLHLHEPCCAFHTALANNEAFCSNGRKPMATPCVVCIELVLQPTPPPPTHTPPLSPHPSGFG
jgi:hypothetical protein